MIVIFAVADQRGAQVMTKRIEDQLKLIPDFADSPSRPVLQSDLVDLSAVDRNPGETDRLTAVASHVDAEVAAIIAQRN